MNDSERKIAEHLNVAHATELALIQTLTAHIAITPRGSYRSALDRHLGETREHARRVERRLVELGEARSPVQAALGLVESAVGQVLALSKGPIDMLRGTSAEEKLLRNARDECATEGLEIGAYTVVEQMARAVGDDVTADLAAEIREDEERMLADLLAEISDLADAVVRAELGGAPAYDPTTTGAADAARAAGRAGRSVARRAGVRAKSTARRAREVPGVTPADSQVKAAAASEQDLPIASYDSLNASDVAGRLPRLSQVDLGTIDAYERRHENRTTILERIDSLREPEPWAGYDDLTVEEVRSALAGDRAGEAEAVRDYERRHKDRAGVIEATEREHTRT